MTTIIHMVKPQLDGGPGSGRRSGADRRKTKKVEPKPKKFKTMAEKFGGSPGGNPKGFSPSASQAKGAAPGIPPGPRRKKARSL